MRNKLFILCIILSIKTFVKAQDSSQNYIVKGEIFDSSLQKPIEKATIQFYLNGKEKYMLTDKNGIFLYQTPKLLDSLKISAIGFDSKVLKNLSGYNINLQTIFLIPKVKELKEVSVTAQKKAVTFELNKITYNVQSDPENKDTHLIGTVSAVTIKAGMPEIVVNNTPYDLSTVLSIRPTPVQSVPKT